MNLGSVHGFVHGLVFGLVHGLVYGTWFMVSLIMFLTLRRTWGFYLNHLIPLRPFKSVFDNVLLEHGGLHCVLPFAVHTDLGHPPDTQEYLGLLSEPFNTTQTFKSVFDNVLL